MKTQLNSYNCFYSALYDILEPHFTINTHLLINNRWQFFFNPKSDYTDDLRPVGELPLLYDEKHLDLLKDILNIDVRIVKKNKASLDDFLQIVDVVPVIIFVNKIHLIACNSIRLRRCVSTIMVKGKGENGFICKAYDKDLISHQNIKPDTLYNDWIFASEREQLNGCYIKIIIDAFPKERDIVEFARICMLYSLTDYINSADYLDTSERTFLGLSGLIAFAKKLTDRVTFDSQKLIDCSMYLDIVIRQRKCFALSLKKMPNVKHTKILIELNEVIERWENIRMLLFIIGNRKQEKSLIQIHSIINKMISDEMEIVKKIKQLL